MNRVSKGKRIISDIFTILENTSLGPHYFQIAVMLRESLLVSTVLYNCQCWHNLSVKELKELSNLDRFFFSSLFKVPITSPLISFFTETGTMSLEAYIKARRVLYYFNLTNRPKDQMIHVCFKTQYSKRNNKTGWMA